MTRRHVPADAARGRRGKRGETGAALVEVLVAAAILALALVPLAQGLTMSLQAVRSGGVRLQAATVLEQAWEEARSDAARDFPSFLASGTTVRQVRGFEVTRTVSAPPPGLEGTALVRVTVSRDGRRLADLRAILHPGGF